jgi:hypothetical protein
MVATQKKIINAINDLNFDFDISYQDLQLGLLSFTRQKLTNSYYIITLSSYDSFLEGTDSCEVTLEFIDNSGERQNTTCLLLIDMTLKNIDLVIETIGKIMKKEF